MRKELMTGRRTALLLICLMGVTGSSGGGRVLQKEAAGQMYQWDMILSLYDPYVAYPSLDNARRLIAVLPSDRPIKICGNAESALRHIFSIDYHPVLFEEAISGAEEAIEVYFRLLNITDGLYIENVLSALGLILRNHPRLFLQLLNNYKDTKEVRTWGYPIDFIGSGHNMHLKAALHILEKRIEALETVEDADLKDLRDACVAQLRRSVKLRAR